HGVRNGSFASLHQFEPDDTKSFFVLDREACILCGRCTVACDDVQQIGAIAMLGRGHAMKVGVFGDGTMASSVCTSCGQCVATCPTGALRSKEAPAPIDRRVETTCPYCGVGCGIGVDVRADGRLAVMADDAPANRSSLGTLCVKGRFGTGFVHARDRITMPLVKVDGRWREASWDEALDLAADGLARHHRRFGALASAKATNEDGYVIQKFVRAVMGTNNVDHCTRLCHSPSVEVMLDEGLANLDFVRARTEGFETWRQSLEPFTLEQAERVTGVPKRDIAQAARWYARPPFAGSCLVWGMGITQHVNGIHNAHTLL